MHRLHHSFAPIFVTDRASVCGITRLFNDGGRGLEMNKQAIRVQREMTGKTSLTRGKTDGNNKRKRTGEIEHTLHCSTDATSSLLSLYVISASLFLSDLYSTSWLTKEFVHFFFANTAADSGAQLAARHEASGMGCVYVPPPYRACLLFLPPAAFIFPDA
jgi:hypothetical protein